MGRLVQHRHRLFIGLLSISLVLTACSDGTGMANKNSAAVPPTTEPTAAVNTGELFPASSDELAESFSINVIVMDEGFQPPSIFIPAGRRVRLVLRNRGTTEHHFRVLGLLPQDLVWQAPVESTEDTGKDEEDGHVHHRTGLVAFKATSPAGIRPLSDEVHAYAEAGGGDMVIFTAASAGTFLVHCPLHPEITGKVKVFGNAAPQVSVVPPAEDPAQKSLKSAAVLRELIPLLSRTETIDDRLDIEALYEAPVLFELTGRTPRQPSGIAFTISESVHDGELPAQTTKFVLRVDDKGPFAPLQVKQLNNDPHHRITYYVFAANDSNGSPLIKGEHQHITLSVAPDGATGTASVILGWHLPISPSTPTSTSTTISLTDAQFIKVDSSDKGFKPNRLSLTKGKRVVLVFRNIGSVEHHLHALTMPVQDILWYAPTQLGSPVPADLDTLRTAQFLPYHICDSESGICPNGLDVHLHARAGDWLVVSFVPSTAGTFRMECSLHPSQKGTIIVK